MDTLVEESCISFALLKRPASFLRPASKAAFEPPDCIEQKLWKGSETVIMETWTTPKKKTGQ